MEGEDLANKGEEETEIYSEIAKIEIEHNSRKKKQ